MPLPKLQSLTHKGRVKFQSEAMQHSDHPSTCKDRCYVCGESSLHADSSPSFQFHSPSYPYSQSAINLMRRSIIFAYNNARILFCNSYLGRQYERVKQMCDILNCLDSSSAHMYFPRTRNQVRTTSTYLLF